MEKLVERQKEAHLKNIISSCNANIKSETDRKKISVMKKTLKSAKERLADL